MESQSQQRGLALLPSIPKPYQSVVKNILLDPQTNEGIDAMMGREQDFRSPLSALFAGIAMVPLARALWEDRLDTLWARNAPPKDRVAEVVIGSGYHAAVYVASRVAAGHPAPVVIEKSDRAGGAFAMTKGASFFLNSRNRPGNLGLPGREGNLNYLPGAILQPADISGEEYMVNSDIAFIIRATLALSGAKVVLNSNATDIAEDTASYSSREYNRETRRYEYQPIVRLENGRGVRAKRIIIAAGLGDSQQQFRYSKRVITFQEFMKRMDSPFPLRNLGKVCVIGAGDSGKVVIEALTGLGPARHWSTASLDFVNDITWYGSEMQTNRVDWEQCNRPRYKEIGTLFAGNDFRKARVRPIRDAVNSAYVEDGYDSVEVMGVPYDTVIACTGFEQQFLGNGDGYATNFYEEGSAGYRALGLKRTERPAEAYIIGPAANLGYEATEQMATPARGDFRAQQENLVAMYRYAGRTAQLAKVLS